jgi:hypothetical protein
MDFVSTITMAEIRYSSLSVRETVENWKIRSDSEFETLLNVHMDQKFRTKAIDVLRAEDTGTGIELWLTSDAWGGEQEFVLTDEASLFW